MSAKNFFASEAPVSLKGDDAQLLKILRDPEYQRLWQEQSQIIAKVDAIQNKENLPIEEIRRLAMLVREGDAPIKARFEALGGLPKNHYIVRGQDGQPQILRKTTTAGQIGRMGRQMALMAGAAFGAPALVGALSPASTVVPAAAAGGGGAAAGGGGAAAGGGLGGISVSAAPLSSLGIGTSSALGAYTAPLAAAAAGAAPVTLSGGLGAAGTIGGSAAPVAAATTPAIAGGTGAGVAGGGGAAGGGGTWASMLKGSSGDYVNAGASLIGAATSGQHGLTVANRDLIRKLLAEYNRTQPYRQGAEKSFAGRLPTHMQANIAPLAPQGLQTLFGTNQQSPLLPDYSNIDYPRFPY